VTDTIDYVAAVKSLFSSASSTIAIARPFAIPASLRQGRENVNDLSIRTLAKSVHLVASKKVLRPSPTCFIAASGDA
jgi:hypothetical protein